MDPLSSEAFLQAMNQWGIPLPPARPRPMPPISPYLSPTIQAEAGLPMPLMTETPVSAPAALEEDVADPTAGVFSPAPFTPPGQMARPANQDVFGRFMETLGMRAPVAQQTTPATPLMLRAQPVGYPGGVMQSGMMGAPRKAPLPKVHPELARRFPGSARMAELLDGARRRKGLI